LCARGDRRCVRGERRGTGTGLGEPDWAEALESIARCCAGRPARLSVLGNDGFAGTGAGPYPLRLITYDAVSREVLVGLGGDGVDGPALRCFIYSPNELAVAEENGRIRVVVSGVGATRTLIEVHTRRRGRGASVRGEPPVAIHPQALRRGARHGGSRAV